MIQAKEAKQIAWRNTHKPVIAQYNLLDKLIRQEAENGNTKLIYPCELYDEVAQALHDYGYDITYYKQEHQLIPDTIIRWE